MKKIIRLAVLSLLMILGVSKVEAGTLTGAKLSLSTPLQSVRATHTFTFTTGSPGTIKSVKFQYVNAASGTTTKPTGLKTDNNDAPVSDLGDTTPDGLTGNWTLNKAVNGVSYITTADGGADLTAGSIVTVILTNITNSAIDDCQPDTPPGSDDNSSDTCYVIITTYGSTDTLTLPIDTTTVSYSVVQNVTVTAKVDPIFTFVINGVPATQTYNGITTSVASAFNTLPFGNLTANVPKYAAHRLNVTTNTQGGYTIESLLTTPLTGVYSQNNIDPFFHVWNTPAAWTSPTGGTANENTGFFGANTTDSDVGANWIGANGKFGGIVANTGSVVMKGAGSDNGTTAVYVTYAVEANVFQPSDQYTGILVYNALPTY